MITKNQILALVAESTIDEHGWINVQTFDADVLQIILDSNEPAGLNEDIMWRILFTSSLGIRKSTSETGLMSDDEKNKFAEDVLNELSGMPYDYNFYYPLPIGYASTFDDMKDEIHERVSVFKTDTRFIESLGDDNYRTNILSALDPTKKGEPIINENRYYMKITDSGFIMPGESGFVNSDFSPDRIYGLYVSLQVVLMNISFRLRKHEDSNVPVIFQGTKYVGNFTNPLSARGEAPFFDGRRKRIEYGNELLGKLITKSSVNEVEQSRIQIANSLFWYLKYLNDEDASLNIVYIVSAIDSLFGPKTDESAEWPTAGVKIPVVAESVATSESDKKMISSSLKKLYGKRNLIIHGSEEILTLEKENQRIQLSRDDLINRAELIYVRYIVKRLDRYGQSI